MHALDHECPQVSLASWAQTARPIRLGASSRDEAPTTDFAATEFEPTDDYLFGFSTAVLLVAPFVLLVLVVFG